MPFIIWLVWNLVLLSSLAQSAEGQPSISPKKITWDIDSASMVLISPGHFQMGANENEDESFMKDAHPAHSVELDAFYMDMFEVTIGQYKKFSQITGHRTLPNWVSEFSSTDNHPVVGVSWGDAVAYAKWAGKRLPTEAEWEYAARGGLRDRRYPWGNDKPNGSQCNYADQNANAVLTQGNPDFSWADLGVDDGYSTTAPVGSFPPNGFGLYDMAGNVYEWCADWYKKDYYSQSPTKKPTGPNSGEWRVLRGGSWSNDLNLLRVATRGAFYPGSRLNSNGFRCVSNVDRK